MEFIWRRRYADDLWNRLLHAMQHVIYNVDDEAENIDPNNNLQFIFHFYKNGGSYTIFDPSKLIVDSSCLPTYLRDIQV